METWLLIGGIAVAVFLVLLLAIIVAVVAMVRRKRRPVELPQPPVEPGPPIQTTAPLTLPTEIPSTLRAEEVAPTPSFSEPVVPPPASFFPETLAPERSDPEPVHSDPVSEPPPAPEPMRDPEPPAPAAAARVPAPVAAPPPASARAGWGLLVGTGGAVAGRSIPIDSTGFYIGRDHGTSQVIIENSHVSKRHLWIGVRGDSVVAVDQQSTNGTYLNNLSSSRITEVVLQPGDTLIIADDVARFEYQR